MNLFRILGLAAVTALTATAADCDRPCMKQLLTQYLDAVVSHKPESLALAPNVRFTEDSKDLKLGEGLWKTATKLGGFRQDYIDLKASIAATHAVLLEEGAQAQYSVLLRVADRKITGIETLINRITPNSRFQPEMLGKPLAGFSEPVPAGKRMPREEAIRIAMFYPEGLRIGSFVEAKTPFAKEGYRVENGAFMAGEGCPRASCPPLLTQKIIKHPDIKTSVAVVDEEEGAVVLWMNFGDTNSYGPGNALVTFEAFKVWGGEIHAVNAFFRILPKETQRGWN
jgi:hypothetical protein